MDRLFVPFDRLGAEQTEVEGTGIGLALSKRLVEVMGGTIGAESIVGRGSTFWLELQTADPPIAVPVTDLPFNVTTKGGHHGSTRTHVVLYIEDNPSNLRLIERVLARRPQLKLLTTMQGSLGIDLAREHHPDLILLDLNLPDIPGHDVMRRLQETPATSTIPVVVLTADATKGEAERLLQAGARAYITKPINVQEVLDVLDETLQAKVS
jgi:CheY-like chemotaxis protein